MTSTAEPLAILFRPVGEAEYDLVAASGFSRFPPRLPAQPIFYPVLTEAYAVEIARDWNTRDEASGYIGYVLRWGPIEVIVEFHASPDSGT